jgi:hypothetical protein
MLHLVSHPNFNFDNYITLSIAISVIGITFCVIKSYRGFGNVFTGRQIDSTRVQEGLPTDVTLTPEDFRAHPELAEIFEVADTDNNLDLVLESNEHFEQVQVQAQLQPVESDNLTALYDIIEAFISSFF